MGMIDGDGGASPAPSGKGDKGPVRVTGPIGNGDGDGDRGVPALGTVTRHDTEAQTARVSSVDSRKAQDSEQACLRIVQM